MYSLDDMIRMDIDSLHGKIFKMISNAPVRENNAPADGAQQVAAP